MATLKDVKVGQSADVAKLTGTGALKRRIMDMGLTKGTHVYVKKVAPLGDPIELTALSSLKSVVLPQLGLPARPMNVSAIPCLSGTQIS